MRDKPVSAFSCLLHYVSVRQKTLAENTPANKREERKTYLSQQTKKKKAANEGGNGRKEARKEGKIGKEK